MGKEMWLRSGFDFGRQRVDRRRRFDYGLCSGASNTQANRRTGPTIDQQSSWPKYESLMDFGPKLRVVRGPHGPPCSSAPDSIHTRGTSTHGFSCPILRFPGPRAKLKVGGCSIVPWLALLFLPFQTKQILTRAVLFDCIIFYYQFQMR
jgi:hypothetical protein